MLANLIQMCLGSPVGFVGFLLLLVWSPSAAHAQASTNFALAPGVLGPGGRGQSANFAIQGELAGTSPRGRSSSATRDVIAGFIGGAFDSRATIAISTAPVAFASVAFPVRATSNAVTAVLDELGPPDIKSWRLGHWSPPNTSYVEALGGGLTSIAVGDGYWLITDEAATVRSTGLPSPPTEFTVALQGGPGDAPEWNQLGNPFLFPVAADDVEVTDGVSRFSLTDPANNLTERVAKRWNPASSSFEDALVLDGRTAYWFKKLAAGSVSVIFPFEASAGSPAPAIAKPEGAAWAVAVLAAQGAHAAEPLLVGAAPVAAGEWNPLDLSRAPAPPGARVLGLYLPKRDWGRMSGDYVRDFLPPAEAMIWEFDVEAAQVPGEVTLTFQTFDLPAGIRLWLSAPAAGWTREVTPGQAIGLAATQEPRHLQLRASATGAEPAGTVLTDAFRTNYPNPFAKRTGLAFTLAREGRVEVNIYDVRGRLVRQLSRTDAPGEVVLEWDGLDAAGRALGAGVYFTRYRVGFEGGTGRLVKLE